MIYTQITFKELEASHEKLKASHAKLLEVLKYIATLHGNLPIEDITDINGINDGKDRAIKLRGAVEIAQQAIKEAEE